MDKRRESKKDNRKKLQEKLEDETIAELHRRIEANASKPNLLVQRILMIISLKHIKVFQSKKLTMLPRSKWTALFISGI